jgi:hypothetical protein
MPSSPVPAARCHYLLDLLAQVPDPRKRRGRRHALAGLLAVGIAAVIAGSRSFAAIGQWAADAGEDVLAVLGADRGPAEESTFRRAFALLPEPRRGSDDDAKPAARISQPSTRTSTPVSPSRHSCRRSS